MSSCHCPPAWATERDFVSNNKKKPGAQALEEDQGMDEAASVPLCPALRCLSTGPMRPPGKGMFIAETKGFALNQLSLQELQTIGQATPFPMPSPRR